MSLLYQLGYAGMRVVDGSRTRTGQGLTSGASALGYDDISTRPRIRTETFAGSKPVPSTSWGSRAWWRCGESNSVPRSCKDRASPVGLIPMKYACQESNPNHDLIRVAGATGFHALVWWRESELNRPRQAYEAR